MIHYKIYNSVDVLPNSWNELPVNDIFLKTSFLKGLESVLPNNITQYYLGVFDSEELIGIAIMQRVQMYVDDVFRDGKKICMKQIAKQLVSKIVRGNALVVGNLMHTGQHGMFFVKDKISQESFLENLYEALEELSKKIKREFNKKIRIIAFKDYFDDDDIHKSESFFKKKKLYKVQVQPNMMFNVLDSWKTSEDYISAFNKKYRRRYRTARKKSNALELKELSEDFIKKHAKEMFKLYETVSDNARVNSFKLPFNHFYGLKQTLKENFRVFGYFLNEKLVGFYTLILNHDVLETYFLGYNKDLQHQHQMYLNMLYNMACFGVENNFKTIVYARTAMEIKSSMGAKPYNMHVYLKHTNSYIINFSIKCIVKYMNPLRKWEERHPFK